MILTWALLRAWSFFCPRTDEKHATHWRLSALSELVRLRSPDAPGALYNTPHVWERVTVLRGWFCEARSTYGSAKMHYAKRVAGDSSWTCEAIYRRVFLAAPNTWALVTRGAPTGRGQRWINS